MTTTSTQPCVAVQIFDYNSWESESKILRMDRAPPSGPHIQTWFPEKTSCKSYRETTKNAGEIWRVSTDVRWMGTAMGCQGNERSHHHCRPDESLYGLNQHKFHSTACSNPQSTIENGILPGTDVDRKWNDSRFLSSWSRRYGSVSPVKMTTILSPTTRRSWTRNYKTKS